ncbi:hypothetical protein VBJFXLJN_CDS_0059 [Pseudomonas phage TIVP-H6]
MRDQPDLFAETPTYKLWLTACVLMCSVRSKRFAKVACIGLKFVLH